MRLGDQVRRELLDEAESELPRIRSAKAGDLPDAKENQIRHGRSETTASMILYLRCILQFSPLSIPPVSTKSAHPPEPRASSHFSLAGLSTACRLQRLHLQRPKSSRYHACRDVNVTPRTTCKGSVMTRIELHRALNETEPVTR